MHDLQELENLSGDALAKYLWKGNEQFADLFNAMVYKRQQLDPSSLQEMDTDLSTLIADKDLLETVRRVRDVVKMASDGATYQILAVENQQAVHYGMAFRCALYDMLTYYKQYHRLEAETRFRKSDRLIPCRTIVLYYGEKKWNAARNLSDLMEFRSPEDKAAFNDYAYELICLNEVDTSKYTFHDKKTRDFFLYVESAFQSGAKDMPEELKEMDVEVAYIAAFFTGTLGIAQEAIRESVRTGKEHVNMCEAVRRTLNETRMEGKTEGFAEGKTEGFAEGKAEGLAEGKAKGEMKGEARERMEIILSMFRNGIPFERVQAVVGQKVTEEELRAFEKEAHSQKLNQ